MIADGQRLAPGKIQFVRQIKGGLDGVWDQLTVGRHRAKWLCDGDWDLTPGGTADMIFDNMGLSEASDGPPERYGAEADKPVRHIGEIRAANPPHRLDLGWMEHDGSRSQVTFVFTAVDDGTALTLTHADLADEDTLTGVLAGWHAHLDIWQAVAAGTRPPSFWHRFKEAAALYGHRLSA